MALYGPPTYCGAAIFGPPAIFKWEGLETRIFVLYKLHYRNAQLSGAPFPGSWCNQLQKDGQRWISLQKIKTRNQMHDLFVSQFQFCSFVVVVSPTSYYLPHDAQWTVDTNFMFLRHYFHIALSPLITQCCLLELQLEYVRQVIDTFLNPADFMQNWYVVVFMLF